MLPGEVQESYQNDDTTENAGLGCALEYFSEIDEVMKMIDDIKTIYAIQSKSEMSFQRYRNVLTLYQEQPHLLDPHLDKILNRLIDMVRSDLPMEPKNEAFNYLHVVMTVRGYKVIVRHLPHEVSDIEPVLKLLESPALAESSTTTRSVLLLWLSIIVMMPFHMSRLDSFEPGDNASEGRKTTMTRIYDQVKLSLILPQHFRAAAYLAAHFLMRSDVKEMHLTSFLEWCNSIISCPETSAQVQCNVMAAIAAVLKYCKREDILPHASSILTWIIESKYRESQISLVRKFGIKIIQRVGLTFLKMRVATWRYQRGCRSLLANLSSGDTKLSDKCGVIPKGTDNHGIEISGDDPEIPDEIEEIIEELMQALKDSEIVIRWSAAKGIGRITGRLPKELANEVVGSVLELFNPRETDGAWHGGCLALAELGRRGLLLPERLHEVVPVVLKALVYDESRGYFSVGSHIRDAACFVCWSFARAYEKDILYPFVKDIAGALLVVACFDREINCRRAASAAFQENVGRQGTFPYGIDILTTADYFTVGVRSNAFLNISVYIAQYEEYRETLINHLVEIKVDHWDSAIRELTAKALFNLTPKAPKYMSDSVLKILLEKTKSIDLNSRHGAVLSVGEILHSLSLIARDSNQSIQDILAADIIEEVCQLIPNFRKRQQFRGLAGELMKQACAPFIEKCSAAMMPFHGREIIGDWQELLDECFSHEVLIIRTRAASALPIFLSEYYRTLEKDESWTINVTARDSIIIKYTEKLSANNEVIRMGFALAIGSLPEFILKGNLHTVIPALIKCTQITESTAKWAESRRDAVKALISVCTTVGVDPNSNDNNTSLLGHLDSLFLCFLESLKEYTLDSRGDIGAWVREAAMTALQILTTLVLKADPQLLKPELVKNIMASIAQQAVERIDRTRAHAGKVFCNLLHSKPPLPHIPCYEEVLRIFPAEVCENEINWLSPASTFPKFTQLIRYNEFTPDVLLGLFLSVGGLSESLVKHSSNSLFSILKEWENTPEELNRICDTIIKLFKTYLSDNRVIVPLYEFLNRLLGSGRISLILKDPESKFAEDIFCLLKEDIRTKDHKKKMASIDVLCQLIQVKGNVSKRAISQLSILLCNSYLAVRRATSSKLYESLLVYGEDCVPSEENLEEIMTLLSETDWEQDVKIVKPVRNKLCELFGIRVPVVVSATKS